MKTKLTMREGSIKGNDSESDMGLNVPSDDQKEWMFLVSSEHKRKLPVIQETDGPSLVRPK